MMTKFSVKSLVLSGITSAVLVSGAFAQGLFSPVVKVNDRVITEFEVEQRTQFLKMLNAPGSARDDVIDELVNDRIRMGASDAAGLEISAEGRDAAMAEFASRANLTKEEFIDALIQNGISEQTFRDFVVVRSVWRELIRARYGSLVDISEAEIDRALAATTGATGLQVLMSEIIIPANPETQEQVTQLAKQINASQSTAEFSAYARQYSAAPTRNAGGQLSWQDLNQMPPTLRPILLSLSPGDVTEPLSLPGAVALFQLRDIRETGSSKGADAAIDFATFELAGTALKTNAKEIMDRADSCDDLYGMGLENPGALSRQTVTPSEIPSVFRKAIASLDASEAVVVPNENGEKVVLMLCGRTAEINQDASRGDVANSLRAARLDGYAATLLEQLRAEARIIRQ